MSSRPRRDVLTDAAIEILAEHGARALTHRAVESRAGLGPGAASNCFDTRQALIHGVLARILVREQEAMATLPERSAGPAPTGPATPKHLVDLGAGMITFAVGTGRPLTLARRALFAEATLDADLSALLVEASTTWWSFVADLLRAAAVPDTERRARWLLAYLDGIITDQLARPEAVMDPAAAIQPAIFGIMNLPEPPIDEWTPPRTECHPTSTNPHSDGRPD